MIVAHIMMNFTQKAEIDEDIIENIILRMQGTFVRDSNPIVRQNALLALQRLQDPDNMEDSVVRVYLFHLEHDPVAKVRTTVISSIAKKLNLMPYIIDRLQDIDEKVRRHVYQQMASFPVKSYRIIDRISFLKAGLNDRSEKVRDTIVNIFLPNWIAAYDRDYTEFIKSFKMDSSEKELASFRELSQKALDIVLKKQKMSELLEYLKITDDSEYPKCIPVEKTSLIEWLIVWKMTIQIYQNTGKSNEEVNNEDESDHEETEKKEVENIVPELSVMCSFIERFAKDFKIDNPNEAKYQNLVFNHSLIVLFEIVQLCDLSDEVGCTRIRELIKYILIEHDVTEFAIKEITEVMQKIDQSPESCINFFNDIVLEMVGTGVSEYNRKTLIEGLIDKADVTLKVKINSLKMELMDLKEKEEVFVERKEYGKAQKVKENYEQLESQLYELLKPLQDSQQDLDSLSADIKKFQGNKKLSANEIVKNLRITFSSLMMRGIKTMNHKTLEIYNNFVRYHLGSSDNLTLVCALKAATSCGMLYESLAKEIFMILKSKIFQSAVSSVWETAINGIIDLILRYGMDKVDTVVTPEMSSTNNRSKKGGRTLYSSFLEEEDEMSEEIGMEKSIDVIMVSTSFILFFYIFFKINFQLSNSFLIMFLIMKWIQTFKKLVSLGCAS
jgi:condensin complex subunit 3